MNKDLILNSDIININFPHWFNKYKYIANLPLAEVYFKYMNLLKFRSK